MDLINDELFEKICAGVHAVRDCARRVPNRTVGLPDNGTRYNISEKLAALSNRIWNDKSSSGASVRDLLRYVLYGGASEELPQRLWLGITSPGKLTGSASALSVK
ncbi:hypothetical protein ACFPL7_12195 [Dongia soli]|uniref:Uncharacterized protein n=1 Tax=Dongia soli TaxID=600628 RepID=A0ABU5EJR4_9PROT|nr:hypothetical protein [Dongia soli]MDY0885426.1 hypothetical protein [Dongia soli]